MAPSPAPPPVFKTLREKKAAQASAEGWAAEVARAEELYEELRASYPNERDFTDSTAAARINGYLAGHGSSRQLDAEIGKLGLSAESEQRLRDLHR